MEGRKEVEGRRRGYVVHVKKMKETWRGREGKISNSGGGGRRGEQSQNGEEGGNKRPKRERER